MNDKNPREIISHLMPDIPSIPVHLSDWDVWRVVCSKLKFISILTTDITLKNAHFLFVCYI